MHRPFLHAHPGSPRVFVCKVFPDGAATGHEAFSGPHKAKISEKEVFSTDLIWYPECPDPGFSSFGRLGKLGQPEQSE
jgi:hypothetical protein